MEAAIDKCCDLKNLEDNWGQIIHVADTYALGQPKRCLKAITAKIFQSNPNISLKAITLLDSCVKNAGNAFAREMSSRDFVSSFKKGYPKLQTKPRMKLIELLKTWSTEYKSNPEFSLLVGIYSWIQNEYPSHIREYETAQNIERRMKERVAYRNLQVKEEEDLAKAIALSLSESQPTSSQTNPSQQQAQSSSSSVYPGLQNVVSTAGVATNGQKDLGPVRALFDFEAAEDNEITFKEGEIITLLDVSDQNWWKGSIRGTEGLFPAQFVTRDLGDANKETKVPSEADQSGASSSQKRAVKIDPLLVENCLEMLGDADTTGVSRPDPEDLPIMEAQCKAMEPLIEAELEGVYTRISEVDVLKQRLNESLAQYHEMVSGRGYAVMPQQAQYGYIKPSPMPPNAYPPPMVYQPGLQPPPPPQQPTTTATVYQPAHVPPPMAAPGSLPGMPPSSSGIPAGVPQPAAYGYPPAQGVYPYPYDPNAVWQQQQQSPAPAGVPPMQPQQQMSQPTAYGRPPANPANVS